MTDFPILQRTVAMPWRPEAAIARMDQLGQQRRAIWWGDDGRPRCGRSGDVVGMLDDLRIPA